MSYFASDRAWYDVRQEYQTIGRLGVWDQLSSQFFFVLCRFVSDSLSASIASVAVTICQVVAAAGAAAAVADG